MYLIFFGYFNLVILSLLSFLIQYSFFLNAMIRLKKNEFEQVTFINICIIISYQVFK